MRFVGFIGPSYTLQSVSADCQRTLNLYPELNELGTGNEGEVATLVATPGLRLLLALPASPIRGIYFDTKKQLWAVGGNQLYKVFSDWTYSAVGTLNSRSGPVSFADNGLQVVLVDGNFGYSYDIATSAFAQITDSDFLGSDQVTCMDTYLVFNKPSSRVFYISGSNEVTFAGGDVGDTEASADNIVGHVATQENLYLFCERHFEIFADTGATFPFERIQGAVCEIGCMAAFTIAKVGSAVCWLGQDKDGRGIVYRAEGLQPQRISNFALETVIARLGDLSGARAWTYSQAGHAFYCLNLPGATTTWVFDSGTNLWHERAYLSGGTISRSLPDTHAFAYGTNVVGDYSNGNLYALDPAVYTDNGAAILRERTAPHIAKDKIRLTHSAFQLDMETGVGLDGTGQGTSPEAMLTWSNDGGKSWSNEHRKAIGPIGAGKTRVIWRRLGQARDRVYRVRITDPVKVTLLGAEIETAEDMS